VISALTYALAATCCLGCGDDEGRFTDAALADAAPPGPDAAPPDVDDHAVNPDRSTITANPANGLLADGVAKSTITVRARDGLGRPVAGVTVVLTVTGDAVMVTQPDAPTDAAGEAVGFVKSTVPGIKTISASAGGVALSATSYANFVP